MCKNPLKQWEVGTEGETYDFGYVQFGRRCETIY